MTDAIRFKGVRTHNLKNLDITIPHRKLVVVTGVSGSGKSSLAFDTLYAEGRRRYVESLSAYARQFLARIEKPDFDFADGILPAIAIASKNIITNARSTVGTQTELLDYLRLLFARIGITCCLSCGKEIEADTPQSIFKKLNSIFAPSPQPSPLRGEERVRGEMVIAFGLTVGKQPAKYAKEMFDELERQGFLSFLVSGKLVDLNSARKLPPKSFSQILVVADQLEWTSRTKSRFFDSLENALRLGKGLVSIVTFEDGRAVERKFSSRFHCAQCDLDYRLPSSNTFSFNSPLGACPECQGFGRVITIDWNLVIPNANLSVAEGVIEPWTKPSASWEWKQLKEFCRRKRISVQKPFRELAKEEQHWMLHGLQGDDYFSVSDFFKYLEKKTYKMHVRIFLSKYRGFVLCPKCSGTRLKPEALGVKINGAHIAQLSALAIEQLIGFFNSLSLSEHQMKIAEPLLLELKRRLSFLFDVGLGYLTLDRLSRTLSGGEAQRIHLAASLGSALVDTLYVLDEPSVGLHERDSALLIGLLEKLRGLGNTVVVVEHDRKMIEAADEIVDLGPLGGERGGMVTFQGPFRELMSAQDSFTAKYFRKDFVIERHWLKDGIPENGAKAAAKIKIKGAAVHNLKHISVEIPLHQLVVVTGVSGSGKSSLIYDVLYNNYLRYRGRPVQDAGPVEKITGWEKVRDVALIDQSQIGRTPRSNPVTYIQVFDQIRKAFASTPEARMRGLHPGSFSFNVPGGRCDVCEGDGVKTVEMHFLADVHVTCDACHGTRFQNHVLEVKYRGKSIYEVLELTVAEAIEFFADKPKISGKLSVLNQVGLGYLRLGQSATTLSGGEAQRLKLAFEIARLSGENLLYLFDEPTTGLHYYDIAALLSAFEILLARGHSICVIEHNMEVIKCADYCIDLGPEGGDRGGEVVYEGPLAGLVRKEDSHTGRCLQEYLSSREVFPMAN